MDAVSTKQSAYAPLSIIHHLIDLFIHVTQYKTKNKVIGDLGNETLIVSDNIGMQIEMFLHVH